MAAGPLCKVAGKPYPRFRHGASRPRPATRQHQHQYQWRWRVWVWGWGWSGSTRPGRCVRGWLKPSLFRRRHERRHHRVRMRPGRRGGCCCGPGPTPTVLGRRLSGTVGLCRPTGPGSAGVIGGGGRVSAGRTSGVARSPSSCSDGGGGVSGGSGLLPVGCLALSRARAGLVAGGGHHSGSQTGRERATAGGESLDLGWHCRCPRSKIR